MSKEFDMLNEKCGSGDNVCPYLKEKWEPTREEGMMFWMYAYSYCSLDECIYSNKTKEECD